jgi:hypothetical protein
LLHATPSGASLPLPLPLPLTLTLTLTLTLPLTLPLTLTLTLTSTLTSTLLLARLPRRRTAPRAYGTAEQHTHVTMARRPRSDRRSVFRTYASDTTATVTRSVRTCSS